jgi:hypothetical protein
MKKILDNIGWFFKEILNMYISKPSHFSKKRIESGIAFIVAQWGMIYYFLEHHKEMDMTSMLMWAGVEFAIAGWTTSQIQKEKQIRNNNDEPSEQINS